MGAPAETNRGPRGFGAMGQQGQVSGDHHLLAQLAVQRQLSVKAVPFQVEDEDSAGRGIHEKSITNYPRFIKTFFYSYDQRMNKDGSCDSNYG